nr:hypothetical protein [uncultured Mediterranean phage uvMED]BAR29176.1 hypothetical protein [uncultured Mediterranean phage uvMED]BAR29181.1 hypothetical protein [uncultured Mediterranean phage uvMED]|tara:strand:+ start:2158 stop:2466 length:309 start_codon:yes stop_codon:yes gene_type:complete
MFKVKYESGKYSRLVGKGKTREEACENLRHKVNKKNKTELLNSITLKEVDGLYRALECMTVSKDEFDEYKQAEGDLLGFKSYEEVDNLIHKLQKLNKYLGGE